MLMVRVSCRMLGWCCCGGWLIWRARSLMAVRDPKIKILNEAQHLSQTSYRSRRMIRANYLIATS